MGSEGMFVEHHQKILEGHLGASKLVAKMAQET
jgi:hypothetical protein